MIPTKISHLYIHIPFCKNFCDYCDFYKEKADQLNKQWAAFFLNLKKEFNDYFDHLDLKTIYIGGGTPNILSDNQLTELLVFLLSIPGSKKEFSIELNPENITKSQLNILKKYSVNRLSIGIQSTNSMLLSSVNRDNGNNLLKNLNLAKSKFSNISFDFIYNLPGQGLVDIDKDIQLIKLFCPQHISWYSLILKEGTPLHERIQSLDIDLDYEMGKKIKRDLKNLGFHQYEVCSFAQEKKYQSVHNLAYWNSQYWLGIGPSSVSFIKKSNDHFLIKNSDEIINWKSNKNRLNSKELYEQVIMMGLRMNNGMDISSKLGKEAYSFFKEQITRLIFQEKLIMKNNYLKISTKYFLLANDIYEELFS